MKKFVVVVFLSGLAGVVVVATVGKFVSWGYASPGIPNELCCSVVRRHYPLRHWMWSGIAPFEGGFIPDPHFLWSEMGSPPEPIQRVTSKNIVLQLVDVNPWFDDESSEILLLIRSGRESYEYSLDRPRGHRVQSVLATPAPPDAMAFMYKSQLAVLVNFFGIPPVRGIYLIPLPFRPGARLRLIEMASPRFDEIVSEFRSSGLEPTTKAEFCGSQRNDFTAFYEKYLGPCDHDRSATDIESRYAEFWQR
jgi:hypothetical protein